MTIALESLATCFQGLIPATFFTCSRSGVPNVAYLSHVDYVDPSHVALSFQFFNKSRKNIAGNPRALVRVIDPDTAECYELRLRYVRSETSGPLFDSMALRVEAIASYSGLKGIFKLLAADIYEVLSVERASEEPGFGNSADRARKTAAEALSTMKALQDLSARINRESGLENLLDSILAGLEELFGFRHSMLLLAGEHEGRLVTIASRGYPQSGAGSEVGYGEGIIGMVAEARKPIRISGMLREMLYANAVRERARAKGVCPDERRIPLPGLAQPESQLGIPLLVRGELIGVLCVESEIPYRFHEADKAYFELLGSYIAIAIQNVLLLERAADPSEEAARPEAPDRGTKPERARAMPRREIAFYRADECILVDGEYLIRGLPAKILWKLLGEHRDQARVEFSNRELRLDKSLGLPDFKDNLECRLLLLRRRLAEKCPDIRIAPRARGRFALDLRCAPLLSEKP